MHRYFLEEKKNSIVPRVAPDLSMETFWYYKNAHTIDQTWTVKSCGVRQRHIDQAQSLNLYITNDYTFRQILQLYILAWEKQVKTIYYIRSKALEVEAVSYTHLDVYKRQDVDYMFVDMPPGTGDVPLTVFQSLPLDGIIIVTSPQELVSMIVEKAVNMADMMNIPILGLVENMSYLKCPDCNKEIQVFGESHVEEIAQKHGLNVLAKLPIDPSIAKNCDKGLVELVEGNWLSLIHI